MLQKQLVRQKGNRSLKRPRGCGHKTSERKNREAVFRECKVKESPWGPSGTTSKVHGAEQVQKEMSHLCTAAISCHGYAQVPSLQLFLKQRQGMGLSSLPVT